MRRRSLSDRIAIYDAGRASAASTTGRDAGVSNVPVLSIFNGIRQQAWRRSCVVDRCQIGWRSTTQAAPPPPPQPAGTPEYPTYPSYPSSTELGNKPGDGHAS